MGLDIHIFKRQEVENHVMSEKLHSYIFAHPMGYGNLKELRKLKDFYLVNVLFEKESLRSLKEEIFHIITMENSANINIDELTELYVSIDNSDVKAVRFSGD